jgi:hypothetical protein
MPIEKESELSSRLEFVSNISKIEVNHQTFKPLRPESIDMSVQTTYEPKPVADCSTVCDLTQMDKIEGLKQALAKEKELRHDLEYKLHQL